MSVPAGQMFNPNSLSSDDIKQVLSAGEISGKQALIAQQMKQAQALRDATVPEGRHAGGMYVAASPLEGLANAAGKFAGAYQQRQLNDQSSALLAQQTADRKKYFDILRQSQQSAAGVPSATGGDIAGVPQGGDY